jgi:predicted O-methyltransferase YrrM
MDPSSFDPEPHLARPWHLYDVAALRLSLLAKRPFAFHFEAVLPDTRGRTETRSGTMTGRQLVRATSRLSQGKWLVRLAQLAQQRCGGGPIKILELGACVGISGCYLLAGMADGDGGHLVTCEGSPELAAMARANLAAFVARHRLGNVTFEVVVGSFAETFEPLVTPDRAPYHLVFIDGHHQEDATLRYHERCRAVLHPRGLIAHDDIDWSDGMRRVWKTLEQLERDQAIIELYQGNRPSRAVIFYGDPPLQPRPRYHLDSVPERLARQAVAALQTAHAG